MRNRTEEWRLIANDFAEDKVCFDVIEEFVEELLDDVKEKEGGEK